MAKATATVTVYGRATRGGYAEILSAEQYEEKVVKRTNEIYEDDDMFYEWLEDNYSTGDVWNRVMMKSNSSKKKSTTKNVFSGLLKKWSKSMKNLKLLLTSIANH